MNDESKVEHLGFITKALQQFVDLKVLKNGFINPDHFRQNPSLENYWADGYDFTFFLVCESLSENQEHSINQFLRQKIIKHSVIIEGEQRIVISFGGGGCHYRPGDILRELDISTQVEEFQYLDTKMRIPNWLDTLIYHDLNASYAPDHERFATNLELTEEEVRNYLGTYCLRSFGEALVIFQNLLNTKKINDAWKAKKELNILDIGSGTGGNLAGLIMAVKDAFDDPPVINILSLDGNRNMLIFQEPVIKATIDQYPSEIHIHYQDFIIRSPEDLETIATNIDYEVDLIMTFKCLSEINSFPEIYSQFIKYFADLISQEGFIIVLDITTKDNLPDFNPILMNSEIRRFEKQSEFRTLLPLSCSIHNGQCVSRCFTQQQFLISHSRKENDVSKVAYRILGRSKFVNSLLDNIEDGRFITKWRVSSIAEPEPNGYCFNSNREAKLIDAYYLI
jgi:hypothetical protein